MHAKSPLLHNFQLDARKGLAGSFEKDVYIAMQRPGGVNYLLDKLCLCVVVCLCVSHRVHMKRGLNEGSFVHNDAMPEPLPSCVAQAACVTKHLPVMSCIVTGYLRARDKSTQTLCDYFYAWNDFYTLKIYEHLLASLTIDGLRFV